MMHYKLVTGASHPTALVVTIDKHTLREAYPNITVHTIGAVLQALYDAADETGISRDVVRDTITTIRGF